MKDFFKLNQRKTTVKTEFIAGMTTFFAMVYILMVNANMFANPFGDGSNPLGVSYGAICGTSTVTTFSEVNAGGRTGLTSLFAGAFFFVAMFLSPVAQLVPSCATAAHLYMWEFL